MHLRVLFHLLFLLTPIFQLLFHVGTFGLIVDLDESELGEETSLRVLKLGCVDSHPVKVGDLVKIKLVAFSPIAKSHPPGETIQEVVVGNHSIVPLNDVLVGMKVGEVRRQGIPIMTFGKIYYEVHLLSVIKTKGEHLEL
ncbi:uncharacterized protein BdWA1_003649 [Babesia duncani]|uniref:Peptidylprolyl isomerase n=1 Tax=Babesia duncani TaxID=323732 RepID=A0AAD9PI50_9APIC|nr:hypothetical protein BdWA1_003649 [Babesia duncani]